MTTPNSTSHRFLSLGVVEHKYALPKPAEEASAKEILPASDQAVADEPSAAIEPAGAQAETHRRTSSTSSAGSSVNSAVGSPLGKSGTGRRFLRLGVASHGEGDWFEVIEEEALNQEKTA